MHFYDSRAKTKKSKNGSIIDMIFIGYLHHHFSDLVEVYILIQEFLLLLCASRKFAQQSFLIPSHTCQMQIHRLDMLKRGEKDVGRLSQSTGVAA